MFCYIIAKGLSLKANIIIIILLLKAPQVYNIINNHGRTDATINNKEIDTFLFFVKITGLPMWW